MNVYTAHLRKGRAPQLVREGFSWGALLFGPFWLAAHRAWVPAALLLAAWVLVAALTPGGPLLAVPVIVSGLFGNDARRWSLELSGYKLTHVLAARDESAAFCRLMAARLDLAGDAAGLPA